MNVYLMPVQPGDHDWRPLDDAPRWSWCARCGALRETRMVWVWSLPPWMVKVAGWIVPGYPTHRHYMMQEPRCERRTP